MIQSGFREFAQVLVYLRVFGGICRGVGVGFWQNSMMQSLFARVICSFGFLQGVFEWCFSVLDIFLNFSGILLMCRFFIMGQDWGLRFCRFDKVLEDIDVVGFDNVFRNVVFWDLRQIY